jgi:hypothetical protein
MSVRTISRTNLQKTIASVMVPTTQDVNSAVAQAINALFTQHCRKVDSKGDCVVAPVDPKLLAEKFMQDVLANAYLAYEVAPGQPNLPHLNFTAQLTLPYTELLSGRLKPNVALAVAGFIVASPFNPFPVTAVNVYKDTASHVPWKTATLGMAIPIDLPNLMPSEIPMKPYLMLLSEPVIIPPGDVFALRAVVNPIFTTPTEPPLQAWIMWIPPVILTSRSAYTEATAPQQSPML